MAAAINVLYPNVADATFDLAYYMNTHMPLVSERFTAHGLTGWRVVKIVASPDGPPLYSILATLEFGSPEQFTAAIAAEGAVVMGDVPNFSNKDPLILIGDVVGTG